MERLVLALALLALLLRARSNHELPNAGECAATLLQNVTARAHAATAGVCDLSESALNALLSPSYSAFNECIVATIGSPQESETLKWTIQPSFVGGIAMDILRQRLIATPSLQRWEVHRPGTLPPPEKLTTSQDLHEAAQQTNNEYAFVLQDVSAMASTAFLNDPNVHSDRATTMGDFHDLTENACVVRLAPRGVLHPRTYLLLFYRADTLAALNAAGLAPEGDLPPSDWQSMLALLEAHASAVQQQQASKGTGRSSSNSLPRWGLCINPDATCGRIGDVFTAIAASVVQTQGTSQGYFLDLSPPPPAFVTLFNSSGWRYAASLLQRMLLFNAPPDANAAAAAATGNPDDEGAPSCHGIGAQTFQTGECFMTMEWDAALPMATNMPSLRDTLRVAPLPGSRFVMPRRGAGGQAPTASQDGVPEGLARCTAELCSVSVNHDLLYLQPNVFGAEAAAAAASDGSTEARPSDLGSVLPTFAAREAAAVARLRRNPGHARLGMPLVNRAPYSAPLDIDVSLRLQGTGVDPSSLGDVVTFVSALRLGIDSFRASRQNDSDALRRAATGFVMDSLREQMNLCDGYARGDWWRVLAPSGGNLSRNGVGSSTGVSSSLGPIDSTSTQLVPHWADDARTFATALRTDNAVILVSYYRSVWHAVHTPNAAPINKAATTANWLRYAYCHAARLLLPPNNTAVLANGTDGARRLLLQQQEQPANASAIDAAITLLDRFLSMAVHNVGDAAARKIFEDNIAADEWHAPEDGPPSGLDAGEKAAIAAAVATFGCLVVVMVILVLLGVRRARLRRHRDLWGNVLAPRAGPDTTLLITDVQNSTVLWESINVVTMDLVLKLHHGTIRTVMLEYDGYESATEGDSFVIAFATPAAALGFATSCQVALLRLDWPARLLDHPDGAPVLIYSPVDPNIARDGRALAVMAALGFLASSGASSRRLSDSGETKPRRAVKWRLGGTSVRELHVEEADAAAGPAPLPAAPNSANLPLESGKFDSGIQHEESTIGAAVGSAMRNPAAARSGHRARFSAHSLMGADESKRRSTHTGAQAGPAPSASAYSTGGVCGGDATSLAGGNSTRRTRPSIAGGLPGAEGGAAGLQQLESPVDDGRPCTWRDVLAAAFPVVSPDTTEGRRLLALVGAFGGDGDESNDDGGSRSSSQSREGGLGGQASGIEAVDGMARLSRNRSSQSRLWSSGATAPVLRLADGRIALVAYRGLRVRMGMHSGLQDDECVAFNKVSSSYDYKGPFSEMARMVNDAAPGGLISMSRATFARLRNTNRSTAGNGEAAADVSHAPSGAARKRLLSALGRDTKHTSEGGALAGAVVVYAGTHVLAEGGPHPPAPRALSVLPRPRTPSIAMTLASPGEDLAMCDSDVVVGAGSGDGADNNGNASFDITLVSADAADSFVAQRSPGPVAEAALHRVPSRGVGTSAPAGGGGAGDAGGPTDDDGMVSNSILPLVGFLASIGSDRGRNDGAGNSSAGGSASRRGGASRVSMAQALQPAATAAAPPAPGDRIHNLFLAVHPSLVCRLALSPPLRVVRMRTLGSLSAPVRRVCVAFMKVVGASSLLADLPGPAARAMEQYQRIAARTLGAAGGYLVEGADGLVLAVFGSPTAAVGWSLDCMAALRRHTWEDALLSHELCMEEVGVASAGGASGPPSPSVHARNPSLRRQASVLQGGPRIKCGLDVGTCTHTLTEASGRLSYRGRAMNRASRIAGICSPGQVLVSGDVWHACYQEDESILERFTGASLGCVTLKGVALPLEVVQVTRGEL